MEDMVARGRGNYDAQTKLTDEQIPQVQADYDAIPEYPSGKKLYGEVSKLAVKYGVSHNLISMIGKRQIRVKR
jgi:hypothetical protein